MGKLNKINVMLVEFVYQKVSGHSHALFRRSKEEDGAHRGMNVLYVCLNTEHETTVCDNTSRGKMRCAKRRVAKEMLF